MKDQVQLNISFGKKSLKIKNLSGGVRIMLLIFYLNLHDIQIQIQVLYINYLEPITLGFLLNSSNIVVIRDIKITTDIKM